MSNNAQTKTAEKLSLNPPRGTYDVLPAESQRWQYLEELARNVLDLYGYQEIRFPVFEHTELFKRGVGETTDIVNKEMYTFEDKGGRSLTLRPEGTASAVRAYLNGGMHRLSPPVKLYYMGPMFRYERPQLGRNRQFSQIGVEALGSEGPLIDAEVIALGLDILNRLGLKDYDLVVNSIGCEQCRPVFRSKLQDALRDKLNDLCEDCQLRFERNPLRMLDCKVEKCQSYYHDVPSTIDSLCQDCTEHWSGLLSLFDASSIKYVINKRLVRGLDYYNRTAFEVISKDKRLGSQATVLAGGRYDGLVSTLGGQSTPAVGWGLGMERLLLLLEDYQAERKPYYIVSSSPQAALELAQLLRANNLPCQLDMPVKGGQLRGFSKQLQQANKANAQSVLILMEDEIANKTVTIKSMQSGEQATIKREELISKLLVDK